MIGRLRPSSFAIDCLLISSDKKRLTLRNNSPTLHLIRSGKTGSFTIDWYWRRLYLVSLSAIL